MALPLTEDQPDRSVAPAARATARQFLVSRLGSLLALLPLTALLFRVVRKLLPEFLREGWKYYAFVSICYALFFIIARFLLLDIILNTDIVLLFLIFSRWFNDHWVSLSSLTNHFNHQLHRA